MKKIACIIFMLAAIFVLKDVASAAEQREIAIVMYHSVSNRHSISEEGEISPWTITEDEFRADMEYLRTHGYEPVYMSDLIAYVDGRKALPNRAVVLTFDDGYLNNLSAMLPILKEYGYRATVSIVGSYIDYQSGLPQESADNFMTWEQIETLYASGCIELANHTWAMHKRTAENETGRNGCTQKTGETIEAYHAALVNDINTFHRAFEERKLPVPTCFTYPHGQVATGGEAVIYNAGYRATLTTTYGKNVLVKGSASSLINLKRVNRSPDVPVSTILIKFFGAVNPVPVPEQAAVSTPSAVLINGDLVEFDAYNINGNNYFKLRDLAFALNHTEKRFEVAWDGVNNAIFLTGGAPYTVVGGEMNSKGVGSKKAKPTNSKVYLDNKGIVLTAYNIEGNNYFKLRDIGEAFDFKVEWNDNTIIIDTSAPYTAEG